MHDLLPFKCLHRDMSHACLQVSGEGLMQTYISTGPLDLSDDEDQAAHDDKSVKRGSSNAV